MEKEVWVLTYDDGTESGAFSTREKARESLNKTVSSSDDITDFHLVDEISDSFEFYHYHNGYEKVEAIIEKLIIDRDE